MKTLRVSSLLFLLILAGCVAMPSTFVSPVPTQAVPQGWLLSIGGAAGSTFQSPVAEAAQPDSRWNYYYPIWLPGPIGKLGLSGGTPEQARALGASWLYDWGPTPPYTPDSGIEAVPMIWGADAIGVSLGGNSRWGLQFNEPDLDIQANIAPAVAAGLIREIETLYPDVWWVSPAVLDPVWLVHTRNEYIARYGVAPNWKALAFHCYRWSALPCIELAKQFVVLAQAWNIPEVWVTEFVFVEAWTPDPALEARLFLAYLEAEPLITRYTPFVAYVLPGEWYWPDRNEKANPSQFEKDGSLQLTTVGGWYER